MNARVLDDYDELPAGDSVYARVPDEDTRRVTVHANGIVVDVIGNEDGSVYVETYAHGRGKRAVVSYAAIDAYTVRHPAITLRLAEDI